MRDRLHQKLENNLGSDLVRLNGHLTKRLPNTLSLSFYRIAANQLLEEIDKRIAASAGSACHADQVSISKVLVAMQVPSDWAMGTIRFSVGRGTTEEEVDQAVQVITSAVKRLQKFSCLRIQIFINWGSNGNDYIFCFGNYLFIC